MAWLIKTISLDPDLSNNIIASYIIIIFNTLQCTHNTIYIG